MPNEDKDQWHLPEPLRITNPKVAEASAEFQKQMAQSNPSPLAHVAPKELELQRAARMAEHLEQDYRRIIEQTYRAKAAGLPSLSEARNAIAARLAEAYATLGRYPEALLIDPRPEHRIQYRQVLRAIERPDGEWCDCPPGADYVKETVMSHVHGKLMPLRACGRCRGVNVTELPTHLEHQQSLESQAAQMVKGLPMDEAAKRLRAAGLTSERLAQK